MGSGSVSRIRICVQTEDTSSNVIYFARTYSKQPRYFTPYERQRHSSVTREIALLPIANFFFFSPTKITCRAFPEILTP